MNSRRKWPKMGKFGHSPAEGYMAKIFLLVFFSIHTLLVTGCFWAHEDDAVPTPIVSTPVTPSMGLVNSISRASKRVEILVTVGDPKDCFVSYPYSQVRFELSNGEQNLKVVDPVKRRFGFTARLEDGRTHIARLVYSSSEKELINKEFKADQEDRDLNLQLPCRNLNAE